MTRISENMLMNNLLTDIKNNRNSVNKYSEELTSGLKVSDPGDSMVSGTISQLKSLSHRTEAYESRVKQVESYVNFQNDILMQTSDILARAKEIATQGANETNGPEDRKALAEEVFQIRDHLVSLANSKFQGSYIYGGSVDDTPPYTKADVGAPTAGQGYANGEDLGLDRYIYNGSTDATNLKTIKVTDNLDMEVNSLGSDVFDNAIQSLEMLGRSLHGYKTEVDGSDVPTGLGDAYTSAEYTVQTADIQKAMDLLDTAKEGDISPQMVKVAGRLNRIKTAGSLLDLTKLSTKEVLGDLQDADMIESATNLTLAETALQAAMTVSAQVMRMSILDYL